MERAMREVQEEDEEEDGEEVWTGFGEGSDMEQDDLPSEQQHSDASTSTSSNDEDVELSSVEDEEDDEFKSGISREADNDSSVLRQPSDPKLDYLPEHIFSQALSKATLPIKQEEVPSTKSSLKSSKPNQKRKPRRKQKSKDIVLGYVQSPS